MFPVLIGTLIIAVIVAIVSEKMSFTYNGILRSIIICIGGAFVGYFVELMFGLGFSTPGFMAILSSIIALVLFSSRRKG